MDDSYASTNVTFDFLRNSSKFLDIVLNNINSCILLLDKNMRVRAFNDSLRTLFPHKENEEIIDVLCGEALGCAYTIEEETECGTTTKCNECDIRIAAMKSYLNNDVIHKDRIERPYFNNKGEKVLKTLQFSSRLFVYKREKYIMLIVEDITNLVK